MRRSRRHSRLHSVTIERTCKAGYCVAQLGVRLPDSSDLSGRFASCPADGEGAGKRRHPQRVWHRPGRQAAHRLQDLLQPAGQDPGGPGQHARGEPGNGAHRCAWAGPALTALAEVLHRLGIAHADLAVSRAWATARIAASWRPSWLVRRPCPLREANCADRLPMLRGDTVGEGWSQILTANTCLVQMLTVRCCRTRRSRRPLTSTPTQLPTSATCT